VVLDRSVGGWVCAFAARMTAFDKQRTRWSGSMALTSGS